MLPHHRFSILPRVFYPHHQGSRISDTLARLAATNKSGRRSIHINEIWDIGERILRKLRFKITMSLTLFYQDVYFDKKK